MTTEPTETTLTPAQEADQIALMAKPSILNIAKNKEAYEALRDECAGITLPEFKNPEFKKTHKKVTELSGRLVKARTAATKLVKQEKDTLKQVITLIEAEGDKLIAITAESEKEIKSLKETADGLVEEEKQEIIRQAEEKKQARIASLFALGMKFNGAYYEMGDLTLTSIQVTQYSEAQFEGFVSQAKVVYEAEQLRIAEEEAAEVKRIAEEKAKAEQERQETEAAQIRLQQENKEKQALLDTAKAKQKEQDDLIASLQAQIKAQEAVKPNALEILPSADIKPIEAPKNGSAIKFTEEEKESILHDVLVTEEAVKGERKTYTVPVMFSDDCPYMDARVGKGDKAPIFRIYVEAFLEEATDGLTKDEVSATGDFPGTDFLFMVIKGK